MNASFNLRNSDIIVAEIHHNLPPGQLYVHARHGDDILANSGRRWGRNGSGPAKRDTAADNV